MSCKTKTRVAVWLSPFPVAVKGLAHGRVAIMALPKSVRVSKNPFARRILAM